MLKGTTELPRKARESEARAVKADTGKERDDPGLVLNEREPPMADYDKGAEMDLGP